MRSKIVPRPNTPVIAPARRARMPGSRRGTGNAGPEASGCLVAPVPVSADPARLRDKRGWPGEHEACPGPAPRPASDSLKRDPARTSAAVACEAGVDPGTGSRHRAAMLGQLLLTDNGGLTWHAVTFCNP